MISLATYNDHASIIDVWEKSVRSTHHFLPENYLQEIKALLPWILPNVKLYVWRDADGKVKGFTGVAAQKMEMLFIHPDSMGNGVGTQLANFCIHSLGVDEVDVNEQNEQAVGFYSQLGYELIGRQEVDSLGRPFPILHMRFTGRTNTATKDKSENSKKRQGSMIK